jgi:hypothetical protein
VTGRRQGEADVTASDDKGCLRCAEHFWIEQLSCVDGVSSVRLYCGDQRGGREVRTEVCTGCHRGDSDVSFQPVRELHGIGRSNSYACVGLTTESCALGACATWTAVEHFLFIADRGATECPPVLVDYVPFRQSLARCAPRGRAIARPLIGKAA